MADRELTGKAISYLRFSSPRQELGDSVRRQREVRDRWLARHPKIVLDESIVYEDLGRSGFRGQHRVHDKAALRRLLSHVEDGTIRPGTWLLCESLDRLTREELGDAFELVLGLVNRGIRIVALSPTETILQKPVEMTSVMLAVVELSRGRGESQRKSDLIGPAWVRKRQRAGEGGKILTRRCPGWLTVDVTPGGKVEDGRFRFKPGARATIRRIYSMATDGYGCRAIAATLIREKVPHWVEGSRWQENYVRKVLRSRSAVGEFQPFAVTPSGEKMPAGEPVVGYYPTAVTEAEWGMAEVAARSRDRRGGRPPREAKCVNVFTGLLWDALSGDRLNIINRRGKRMLLPGGAKRRCESGTSFPLVTFEWGVLSRLAEIDPREILGHRDEPDEAAELAAELARVNGRLAEVRAELEGEGRDAGWLIETGRNLEAKRKALVERLDAAKARQASPLSDAWGECKGLVETLQQATDVRAARVRLRQAIGRIVEGVYCVFAGNGLARLAAVQLRFAGSTEHRDYLILHQQAHQPSGRGAMKRVWSFALPGRAGEIDLRDPADAAAVEAELKGLDLTRLNGE